MNEQNNTPDMPQPAFSNWEKASKDELIQEIKTLRRHAALLTTVVHDMAAQDREKMNAAYADIVTVEWQVFKNHIERQVEDFGNRVTAIEQRVGIKL